MTKNRSIANESVRDETEVSARERFFNSFRGCSTANDLVTSVKNLSDALKVRLHHTHTAGGDLRLEPDRPAPAPRKRNVITMTWRANRGYFSCQSVLPPSKCVALGIPADSVRNNNGVLHSVLNVHPGLHDDAFLAVVVGSIRHFREQ